MAIPFLIHSSPPHNSDIGIVAILLMFAGISVILTIFWVLLAYDSLLSSKATFPAGEEEDEELEDEL